MKKFTFSLDRLLNYKRKLFDLEQAKLTELNAILYGQQQQKQQQEQERTAGARQLNERAKIGLNITEMAMRKNYLRELERQIQRTELAIRDTEQKIEQKKEELIQAKTEIRSIERLREKRLEEHNKKEEKAHELFIDEFVNASNYANIS